MSYAKVYLEPSQTPKIRAFGKNSFAKSTILDALQDFEYASDMIVT